MEFLVGLFSYVDLSLSSLTSFDSETGSRYGNLLVSRSGLVKYSSWRYLNRTVASFFSRGLCPSLESFLGSEDDDENYKG